MKKFEVGDIVASVTNDKVCFEIPIDNLVYAFNYSPDNPSEDGEQFVKVKEDQIQEFAEYVARKMIEPSNQETGASYFEEAIDKVFNEVFECYEDFAEYPEYDDDEDDE